MTSTLMWQQQRVQTPPSQCSSWNQHVSHVKNDLYYKYAVKKFSLERKDITVHVETDREEAYEDKNIKIF